MTNASGPGHAAIRQTESGCLALADISGYTSYLAGAELDHAQDVLRMMAGPMQQAVEALRSALRNAAAPQP